MGEARRESRHRPEVRAGPRAAARRRGHRPRGRHAGIRGDRHERGDEDVPAGHRPPARTGHGDVRHAARPPVGDRERDVPDTGARDPYRSGHGSGHGHSHLADVLMTPATPAFPTARARRHHCPPSGRARSPGSAAPACGTGRAACPGPSSSRTGGPCIPRCPGRWGNPDPPERCPTARSRPAIGCAHPERPPHEVRPKRLSASQRIR